MSTTGPQDPYSRPDDGHGDQSGGGYPPPPPPGGGYGAPPPPPAYGGGGYGGFGGGTEKNSLGVWALVLGILGVVCCGFFAGIPAIILGNKSKEAAAQGLANNGGLGQAGVVLGWIGVVVGILWLVYVFAMGGLAFITESQNLNY